MKMMPRLTDEQLDWVRERIPDAPVSPSRGWPTADKRKAIRGNIRILDNRAKWKDLRRRSGSKSTIHRGCRDFRRRRIRWERLAPLFREFLPPCCTFLLLKQLLE